MDSRRTYRVLVQLPSRMCATMRPLLFVQDVPYVNIQDTTIADKNARPHALSISLRLSVLLFSVHLLCGYQKAASSQHCRKLLELHAFERNRRAVARVSGRAHTV